MDLEQRFSHLIQPIRDLTKNWDVDIATQLEEYLEELESISITFDGGAQTMNFAEAALLIQGSACVYSKKVEYLYSLVYQVLDLLASKKKLQAAASKDADGNDNNTTVAQGKDQDEEFLSLDDIKQAKSIDKKIDDNITINVVLTVPKTPLALVPLEESEKGDNPLMSIAGEILGSRMDFKMNTAYAHSSSFMLLDMAHLAMLELSLTSAPQVPDICNEVRIHDQHHQEAGNEKGVSEAQPETMDGEPLPEPDMDDNDGGGFDLPDAEMHSPSKHEHFQQSTHGHMRERRNAIFDPPQKPRIDVWEPLDPHQSSKSSLKPFRKKKTFRIPSNLETEASKKRKHRKDVPERKHQLTPIAEYCAKAYHSHASKFPSNPLKVPAFMEFEQLYWKEFKRRQQRLNREKKLLQTKATHLAELAEDDDDSDHDDVPADDDDEGLRVDFQIPDIQDIGPMHDDFANENGFGGPERQVCDDAHVPSSFEDLVRHHVEGYMASAQQYAHVTDLAKRVSEWEENIIPRLKEEEEHEPFDIHLYGSNVITSIEKEAPPPPNQNQPPNTQDLNIIVPFSKVVERKPAYQVCRTFLATLQLANAYNVEIVKEDLNGLDKGINTMKLKLLSRRRHFEELAEYRAPSINP